MVNLHALYCSHRISSFYCFIYVHTPALLSQPPESSPTCVSGVFANVNVVSAVAKNSRYLSIVSLASLLCVV